MWSEGTINGYEFHVKHYENGSRHGINGDGRISKLEIRKDGKALYAYNRGLDYDNLDADGKAVYEQILERYN